MRLLSRGDRIEAGEYRLHSRFSKAANFTSNGFLVSIVDEQTGPGPYHLVIEGYDPGSAGSLRVETDRLELDGVCFGCEPSRCFNSAMNLSDPVDDHRFHANLDYSTDRLFRCPAPGSLAFLMNGRERMAEEHGLASELGRRFRVGIADFLGRNTAAGIEAIRGLGPGLTPSGDDFISGALVALQVRQRLAFVDLFQTIDWVYERALGKNPFSNQLLFCAREGLLTGNQQTLVESLLYGEKNEIDRGLAGVCSTGATSGTDWAVGLLLTLGKN